MKKNNRKQFPDLLKLARTLRKKNPWHQKQTLESWSRYLVQEALEIEEAIKQKDWEELHEELGDLLWDVAFLLQLAEEQKLFKMQDSTTTAHKKIRRRNPHIFDKKNFGNQPYTHEIYLAIKEQEKKEKEQRKQK